jgi:lipid-binding SYLF domain-containing protein
MRITLLPLVLLISFVLLGCSTAPTTAYERADLVRDAEAKLKLFESTNKGLHGLYQKDSAAVAVFPKVTEGGLIIGYGAGQGVLFENGKVTGYCALDEGSGGALIGVKQGTQFVYLEDARAVQTFKSGGLELTAQVEAIAANAKASEQAEYVNGIAVIVVDSKGLMAEASVSGQKFRFVAKEAVE